VNLIDHSGRFGETTLGIVAALAIVDTLSGLAHTEAYILDRMSPSYVSQDIQKTIRIASNDRKFVHFAEAPEFWAYGALAGSARNLFFIALRKNPSTPVSEGGCLEFVCVGIAELAKHLLEGQDFVQEASRADRPPQFPGDDSHSACYVKYKSGREVVLDWHSTLNVTGPILYANEADFKAGKPSSPWVLR
jgi:hypothetical protein